MAYGLPSQYGSDGNNVGDFVSEQTAGVRDDLTMTLRTMRDSLSTSLQTLNLTMAGVHNQLRNMASAFSPMARQAGGSFGMANTYVPSYGVSANLGSMSTPMASWLANNSLGGVVTGNKPYNVGGYEWALERQREMQSRTNQFITDTGLGMASTGLSMYGSSKLMNALPFMKGVGGAARFAASFPAFAVAGAVLDPFFNTMGEAAQAYGRDISQVQRMSARFGGQTFNRQQSGVAARAISNIAGNELMNRTFYSTNLGIDGAREVMMQGLQNNMFQGSKPEELVKQMEKAAGVVKFLTGVLGSKDISETMQSVAMLKNMGINMFQHGEYANKLGMDAFKYGKTMGIPGAQLLQQATQIGGASYMSGGMPGFVGIQPAMQTMALASEMEKRRFLSAAQMSAGGGIEGITQQTSQFGSAMMGHGAVGQMMFAAGMTGSGFNAGRVKGALGRNGYFGAMHQGLGNLAGDVRNYAKFMMEQDNYASDAALQGNVEDQLDDMLFAALDQFPIMMDDNTAAYQIMNIAQQNGVQLSRAAAKMKVMKHRKPNLTNALNNRANNERDKAYYAYNRLEKGAFRPYSRATENITNKWDSFWHGVGDVGRWGVDVADRATNHLFGDVDNYQGSGRPDGLFNGNIMRGIADLGDWGKGISSAGKLDNREFTRAYLNMKNDPGLISRITGDNLSSFLGDPTFLGETAASRNYGALMSGVNANNYSAYFKEAAQGSMGRVEAEAILKEAGIKTARAYSSLPFSFNNSETGFLDELMESMSKDKANAFASASTGANWYKNLGQTQANNILTQAGIENASGMEADALLQAIVGKGGSGDAIGQFAAANGITRRQAAFGLTQKANGGALSRLSTMHGASTEDFDSTVGAVGTLARITGKTYGVQKVFEQSGNGLNYNSSQLTSALSAVGLTSEDMNEILSTDNGVEQFKQFAFLLSESLDHPDSVTSKDIAKLTNAKLKGTFTSLTNDKAKLWRAIEGSELLSPTGVLGGVSLNDKLMETAGGYARQDALANVQKGLKDIYKVNFEMGDLNKKIDDGTIVDYVLGLDSSTLSPEGQELQGKLKATKGMSQEAIIAAMQKEGLVNKDGSLQISEADIKKKHLLQQFTTDMATKGGAPESTKEKKTLIDEGMVHVTGGWALRTIVYSDPLAEAKDKATPKSTESKGVKLMQTGNSKNSYLD